MKRNNTEINEINKNGIKKGFVNIFDIMLAISVVVLIVVVATKIFLSSEIMTPEISGFRTATDIVAVLDYQNVFDGFDESFIEAKLKQMMPDNINISMIIEKYDKNLTLRRTIVINGDIEKSFAKGKWIFVTFDNNIEYNIVTYKVNFR